MSTTTNKNKNNHHHNNNNNDNINHHENDLLTPLAYGMSLTPPRIPPYDSIQYKKMALTTTTRTISPHPQHLERHIRYWFLSYPFRANKNKKQQQLQQQKQPYNIGHSTDQTTYKYNNNDHDDHQNYTNMEWSPYSIHKKDDSSNNIYSSTSNKNHQKGMITTKITRRKKQQQQQQQQQPHHSNHTPTYYHPHLFLNGTPDHISRFLCYYLLSYQKQNTYRDNGTFRYFCDESIKKLGLPTMRLQYKTLAKRYDILTRYSHKHYHHHHHQNDHHQQQEQSSSLSNQYHNTLQYNNNNNQNIEYDHNTKTEEKIPSTNLSSSSSIPSSTTTTTTTTITTYERIQYGSHPLQVMDIYFPKRNLQQQQQHSKQKQQQQRVLFFIHGGAWGSGLPEFYRLVAYPFVMNQNNPTTTTNNTTTTNKKKNADADDNNETFSYIVVVTGYRTYPDGNIQDQIHDCETALRTFYNKYKSHYHHDYHNYNQPSSQIQKQIQEQSLDSPFRITIMGHSSGAHVGLLLLVQRYEKYYLHQQHDHQDHQYHHKNDIENNNNLKQQEQQQPLSVPSDTDVLEQQQQHDDDHSIILPTIHSYIGLSGPYHIEHHYHYEASRGVEELSPMKPANGYTYEKFLYHSPTIRLQQILSKIHSSSLHVQHLHDHHHQQQQQQHSIQTNHSVQLPPMLLVHGIEDTTVPFTATSEAARMLRSCSECFQNQDKEKILLVEEAYIGRTEHQDTIFHIMMGEGKTLDVVHNWLQRVHDNSSINNNKNDQNNNNNNSNNNCHTSDSTRKSSHVHIHSRL